MNGIQGGRHSVFESPVQLQSPAWWAITALATPPAGDAIEGGARSSPQQRDGSRASRSHEEEVVDTSPPRRSRERAAAAAADLQGSIFDRLTSLETESTRRQKIAKSKERATLERTRARHAAKHGTWQ